MQNVEIRSTTSKNFRITVTPQRITLKEPQSWTNVSSYSDRIINALEPHLSNITKSFRGSFTNNDDKRTKVSLYSGDKDSITLNF